jgi:hypothetical protein
MASRTVLNPPSRNLLKPDVILPPSTAPTPPASVPGGGGHSGRWGRHSAR